MRAGLDFDPVAAERRGGTAGTASSAEDADARDAHRGVEPLARAILAAAVHIPLDPQALQRVAGDPERAWRALALPRRFTPAAQLRRVAGPARRPHGDDLRAQAGP